MRKHQRSWKIVVFGVLMIPVFKTVFVFFMEHVLALGSSFWYGVYSVSRLVEVWGFESVKVMTDL